MPSATRALRSFLVAGLVAQTLFPTAAAAACPAAGDMAQGVRISFDDDTNSIFRAEGDTVIETVIEEPGDVIYIYRLRGGMFETDLVDLSGDGGVDRYEESYSYSFRLDPLLPIRPGLGISGDQIAKTPGFDDDAIPYAMTVGAYDTVDIGGCQYQALPAVARYDYGDEVENVALVYIVELGFSYVIEISSPSFNETYRPLSIEAVE